MSYELAGAAAPPMSNGELDFEAPWQGRVFSMAVALAEAGVFSWAAFQARLIEVIGAWERAGSGEYRYYELFQKALESLLAEQGVVPAGQLARRARTFADRPHGHDH